jgi:hypothetical protein
MTVYRRMKRWGLREPEKSRPGSLASAVRDDSSEGPRAGASWSMR